MKKYKKLLIALAAVASLLIVKETGMDKGLIDNVLQGIVEALVESDSEPEAPAAPAQPTAQIVELPEGWAVEGGEVVVPVEIDEDSAEDPHTYDQQPALEAELEDVRALSGGDGQ